LPRVSIDDLLYLIYEDAINLFVVGKATVDSEIGISYPNPPIIPLCFITSTACIMNVGESPPLQNMILKQLKDLFNVIETIDVQDESKNRKPFELLNVTALHIRLLLLAQVQFGGDDPESLTFLFVHFSQFLPLNHMQAAILG
jgi:hypothetical protein